MTLVRLARSSLKPTEEGNLSSDLAPALCGTCELRVALYGSFGDRPRTLGAAKSARGAKEKTLL